MSVVATIRLLVARHLEITKKEKAAVLNLLTTLDITLDENGFDDSIPEIQEAVKRLENAIIDASPSIPDKEDEDDEKDNLYNSPIEQDDEEEEEQYEDLVDIVENMRSSTGSGRDEDE